MQAFQKRLNFLQGLLLKWSEEVDFVKFSVRSHFSEVFKKDSSPMGQVASITSQVNVAFKFTVSALRISHNQNSVSPIHSP